LISATFDTSVYIRAINFGGPAAKLLGKAKAGDFRLDVSDAILAETAEVLREKFRRDGYTISDAIQKIRAIGNHVTPTEALGVVKEDPDDDRILECAVEAKSDFIVTEDKDLIRIGQFRNIRILTIQGFLELAL
jgi:putative PIN family toxin of toxin-antitoxin system